MAQKYAPIPILSGTGAKVQAGSLRLAFAGFRFMKAGFGAGMMVGFEAALKAGVAMMITRIQHGTLNLVAFAFAMVMVVMASRYKCQKGNQREEEVEFLHGWFLLVVGLFGENLIMASN